MSAARARGLAAALALFAAPALAAGPQLTLRLRLDPAGGWLDGDAELAPPPAAGILLGAAAEPLAVPAWRRAGEADGRVRWLPADTAARAGHLRYRLHLPAPPTAVDPRAPLAGPAAFASPAGSLLTPAADWFPRTDAALAGYQVTLDLPPDQRGLVPGRLLDEHANAVGYRARFASEGDAEALTLFAGPWQVGETLTAAGPGAPLRIRTYFGAALADLAPAYREAVAGYVARYAAAIGPHAHAGFSVVECPLPAGFALPGVTCIGPTVLRLPFIRATSLGHEVLHEWWGNGVRVDPRRGNWSEGLTTFMADYAYREEAGAAAALAARLQWLRDLAALPAAADVPLEAFRARHDTATQSVGYAKAAYVFFMLRERLGEAAFGAGLRRFYADWRGRAAGWDELRAALEVASGSDLREALEPWLTRPGLPAPTLVDARAEPVADGWRLALTLHQPAPPWPLRLPLGVDTDAGTQTVTVDLADTERQVVLTLPARPRRLTLDPELRVARRLGADELPPIVRDLQVAAAPALQLTDPVLGAAAQALAAALFDQPLRTADGAAAPGTLALVGTPATLAAPLAALGVARPAALPAPADAEAWTARRDDGSPLLVIAARDAAALATLAGKLPHYGDASWLTLEHGRVGAHGTWPATLRSLAVDTAAR